MKNFQPSPLALEKAQILWDFHSLEHELKRTDAILVLCSHDIRVVDHAVQLLQKGWARHFIISGGMSPFTSKIYERPEAQVFAKRAMAMGIPANRILIEDKSTNTGENLRFTKDLLDDLKIQLNSCILVQKPNMLRRAFATLRKLWPSVEAICSAPPQIKLQTCAHEYFSMEMMIHELVGDIQRLILYPDRGFTVPQEIPTPVMEAYDFLLEQGYDQYPAPLAL